MADPVAADSRPPTANEPRPATPTGRWLDDQLHDDATAFAAITSGRFSIGNLVRKVQEAIPKIEAEAAERGTPRSLSDSEQPSIEPERPPADPPGLHDWRVVPEAGGACDCHGIRQGWYCANCRKMEVVKYPDMPAIEGCPSPPAESRVRPAAIAADSDQAEALRRALKTVLENERFDLQYSREVSRLVEAVMDHLQASSDTARPKASEGSADGE